MVRQRLDTVYGSKEVVDRVARTASPLSRNTSPYDYKRFLSRIVDSYDSTLIRAYCKARFTIININILQMLGLCLRGKRRVLDIGCGFGLFGCYFSAMYPEIEYRGYDLNRKRIDQANLAAARLV